MRNLGELQVALPIAAFWRKKQAQNRRNACILKTKDRCTKLFLSFVRSSAEKTPPDFGWHPQTIIVEGLFA
jgi:hypothetical protein